MDSESVRYSPQNDGEKKPEFRKLSDDVANRKYRRRSPASASSASEGSPKRHHSSSPIISRDRDHRKVSEHQRRRNEDRNLDRESGRSRDRGGDSHRHNDQHASRNSRGYLRHDDYSRYEKHVDNEKRHHQAYSHSGRESRVSTYSDHVREESEHGKSRDNTRNVGRYPQERYESSGSRSKDKGKDLSPDRAVSDRRILNSTSEDRDRDRHRRERDHRDGKRDYHKSSDENNSRNHEEFRGSWDETLARESGHRFRDYYKHDFKDMDGQMERKIVDGNNKLDTGSHLRSPRQQDNISRADNESVFKKPKVFNSDCSRADKKQAAEVDGKGTLGQVHANNSEATNDLNAAKVAAMKAAELVNKNLVGTGFMSTEQKKKLLWGNKKSTSSVEPVHHWDSAQFGDRERQEKFNKLMGVKGETKVDHKFDDRDSEKQKELQMDLEKQYTAGLRRRDGRTVGLGL